MKKLLLMLAMLSLVLALCIGAAAVDTVYLNDGGRGNGSQRRRYHYACPL